MNAFGAAAVVALGLAALPVAGASAVPAERSGAIVSANAERTPSSERSAERAETLRAEISSGSQPWLERFGLSGISAVGLDSATGETTVRGTEYVVPHTVTVPGLGRVIVGGDPATVVFQTGA
ncbi:hypothetical protein GCM10009768_12610 [Leucobacter iarius]|uniref:Uncharacterized protein n=1 Tax=Leucobacter iarius TaxID=333963 RepID=A0ABP4XJP0_9MICO